MVKSSARLATMVDWMTRKIVKIANGLGEKIGYSRAVRVGNLAFVSGTTALDAGKVEGVGDAGTQARISIEKIAAALGECGMSLDDVVRTRVTMTRAQDWEPIAAAHAAFFADVLPVSAFYTGVQFLHPDILVEIEADAVLDAD